MKKIFYEKPTVDLLVVRFEENIMSNANGYHQGGGGKYDNDDTIDNGEYN